MNENEWKMRESTSEELYKIEDEYDSLSFTYRNYCQNKLLSVCEFVPRERMKDLDKRLKTLGEQ